MVFNGIGLAVVTALIVASGITGYIFGRADGREDERTRNARSRYDEDLVRRKCRVY